MGHCLGVRRRLALDSAASSLILHEWRLSGFKTDAGLFWPIPFFRGEGDRFGAPWQLELRSCAKQRS